MDIRKTRILHRRYNQLEWASKRLKLGEIGILLSDDKEEILQVRVGMSNGIDGEGSLFSEGLLLGLEDAEIETTKLYLTRSNFPSIGSEFVCYIAKDTNSIWRWDSSLMKYELCSSLVLPGQGNGWWKEMNGGGASFYDKDGILLLGNSTERDWELPIRILKKK